MVEPTHDVIYVKPTAVSNSIPQKCKYSFKKVIKKKSNHKPLLHNTYKAILDFLGRMECCVIIPGYNEEKNIQKVIADVQKFTDNIIVVDDGSSDNTAQLARESGVTVLQHSVNLGKGAALKTGCDYAVRNGIQNIIVLDADGQHDPQEIPEFLNALQGNDIVFGKRRVSKSMPGVFRLGNQGISQILKILYGLKVEDSQCGYRAFTADAYKKMRWTVTDYFMETEMIVKAGKHKLKHTQVPIETIYADKYKGTTVVDGMKIVMKMIGWRLFK